MDKNESSIIKELQELKKLFDDGTLNEKEFELAKKRLLNPEQHTDQEDKTLKEIYSNSERKKDEGINRKATGYDALVPIIIISCIVILQGGLIGGAILGAILGLMAYLVTLMTKSTEIRVFLFIIFSVILTFVVSLFTSAFGTSSSPKQTEIDEQAVHSVYDAKKRYYDCRGNGSVSYEFVYDCLVSANLPSANFNNTSCDTQLNTVIQAFNDAKLYCGKVDYYEDDNSDRLQPGVSAETYADALSKCRAALDQFESLSSKWKCGEVSIN